MRNGFIAGIMMSVMATSSTLLAQTNNDEVAQLKQRVVQLEKQVQEISQFLEPLRGQQATIASRRKALSERVSKRIAEDRDKYTPDQVLNAEKLYSIVSQKGGTPEATESFQTMIEKYPDMNRTGCATLYVAQRSQGDQRVKYLLECIEKYDDCMYGDSVQVGAYARFLLAREYSSKGEDKKAEELSTEIKTKYPNAIDHGGNLLVDLQGRITK